MSGLTRVALRVLVAATALVCVAAGVLLWLDGGPGQDVARVSAFPADDARPPPTATEDLTILLLGQDWSAESEQHGRSDAILLARIPWHRSSMTVVSIPRDAWVPLPGHGEGKINSALVLGGPPLAVATVEELTDIRVDHVALIDGDGFQSLVDAMGGVTVEVAHTVHDSARDVTWTAGPHHLDGRRALDYVGQRYGLAGGDLDRVRRHQNLLRTMMTGLLESGPLDDPQTFYRLMGAVTESVVVDEEWSTDELRDLMLSLRYLENSELTFTTAPITGLDEVAGQSVVRLDDSRSAELWTAIREDWGREWVDQAGASLGRSVP